MSVPGCGKEGQLGHGLASPRRSAMAPGGGLAPLPVPPRSSRWVWAREKQHRIAEVPPSPLGARRPVRRSWSRKPVSVPSNASGMRCSAAGLARVVAVVTKQDDGWTDLRPTPCRKLSRSGHHAPALTVRGSTVALVMRRSWARFPQAAPFVTCRNVPELDRLSEPRVMRKAVSRIRMIMMDPCRSRHCLAPGCDWSSRVKP